MLNSTHRSRGRPPGMTWDRIRKRYIIAAGIIMGLKVVDIARQIGVSRSWASREVNSAGARNIIAELIRESWEQVKALFSKTLAVLSETMEARTVLRHRGRIVQSVPDHYLRLEAVMVFIKLIDVAGQITGPVAVNASRDSFGERGMASSTPSPARCSGTGRRVAAH